MSQYEITSACYLIKPFPFIPPFFCFDITCLKFCFNLNFTFITFNRFMLACLDFHISTVMTLVFLIFIVQIKLFMKLSRVMGLGLEYFQIGSLLVQFNDI